MDSKKKQILSEMGFGKQIADVEAGACPFCQKPVKESEFKDELSRKEFKISGICQVCQDDMFKRK